MKLNPVLYFFILFFLAALGISALKEMIQDYREWYRYKKLHNAWEKFKKDQKRKPHSI